MRAAPIDMAGLVDLVAFPIHDPAPAGYVAIRP